MSTSPSAPDAESSTELERGTRSGRKERRVEPRVVQEFFTGRLEEGAGGLRTPQVVELLVQALETEIGGVKVYETAIRCAQNDKLRKEWEKYLAETRNHERVLREVFDTIGLDVDMETPGRRIVRATGQAYVSAMETALDEGEPEGAQLVAAECVVLAETKDHLNWQLIGEVAGAMGGEAGQALRMAYDEIEMQEDEHLDHTGGWARELWLESFGLPAVLPPPEERRDVRSAIGAARARGARTTTLRGRKPKVRRQKARRRATRARTTRGKKATRRRRPGTKSMRRRSR